MHIAAPRKVIAVAEQLLMPKLFVLGTCIALLRFRLYPSDEYEYALILLYNVFSKKENDYTKALKCVKETDRKPIFRYFCIYGIDDIRQGYVTTYNHTLYLLDLEQFRNECIVVYVYNEKYYRELLNAIQIGRKRAIEKMLTMLEEVIDVLDKDDIEMLLYTAKIEISLYRLSGREPPERLEKLVMLYEKGIYQVETLRDRLYEFIMEEYRNILSLKNSY